MLEGATVYYSILVVLGIVGFCIAWYIQHHKSTGKKMVCNIVEGCDRVTSSEYSKFLGIPLELLGMLYYAVIAISYFIFAFFPNAADPQFTFWVLALSASAFLFSVYLTFLQGVVLKDWCQWCLASATVTLLIFITASMSITEGVVNFLLEVEASLMVALGFAVAVGVGGATLTNILFFKFLKDFTISEEEYDILKIITQVTWVALIAFIVVAGTMAFMGGEMIEFDLLVVSLGFAGVVALVELFLNFWIGPDLVHISFGEKHHHIPAELGRSRRFAFALGGISLVSWYGILIIQTLRDVEFDLGVLFSGYALFVIVAVIVSQLVDRSIVDKGH